VIALHSTAERVTQEVQQAARAKGVQLHVLKASNESEIDNALVSLVTACWSARLRRNPSLTNRREQRVALAAPCRSVDLCVARIYCFGLISYGPSLTSAYRLLGAYAGKILKGAKPADLPVQQSTTFQLVINLRTAEALGLTVPRPLLARADEVAVGPFDCNSHGWILTAGFASPRTMP